MYGVRPEFAISWILCIGVIRPVRFCFRKLMKGTEEPCNLSVGPTIPALSRLAVVQNSALDASFKKLNGFTSHM